MPQGEAFKISSKEREEEEARQAEEAQKTAAEKLAEEE